MDGLRLALIITGIVVVAVVYWWTARRRRMEREAGEFDRFDAWTDDSLDPLSDEESITQPNPRLVRPLGPGTLMTDAEPEQGPDPDPDQEPGRSPAQDAARGSAVLPPERAPAAPGEPAPGPAGATRDGATASIGDPAVLEGLEAIADSLDTRVEPSIGDVSSVADSPPKAAAPRRERAAASRGGAAKPARPAAPSAPPAKRSASLPPEPPADSGPPELVIVINVMAPVGATFDGPPLREALENAGLEAGEMKLYHYRTEAQPAGSPPIFSALNMVKPGTLDPEQLDSLRTPGVALVMRLPGPERPLEAFELMHGTATGMAAELGGRLCDESRSTLTRQALNHMRERIAEMVRRRRAGG